MLLTGNNEHRSDAKIGEHFACRSSSSAVELPNDAKILLQLLYIAKESSKSVNWLSLLINNDNYCGVAIIKEKVIKNTFQVWDIF